MVCSHNKPDMNYFWTLFWDTWTSHQTTHDKVPIAPAWKHKVEEKHCIQCLNIERNVFLQTFENFWEIMWSPVRGYTKLASERHMVPGSSSHGTHMQTQSWRKTFRFTQKLALKINQTMYPNSSQSATLLWLRHKVEEKHCVHIKGWLRCIWMGSLQLLPNWSLLYPLESEFNTTASRKNRPKYFCSSDILTRVPHGTQAHGIPLSLPHHVYTNHIQGQFRFFWSQETSNICYTHVMRYKISYHIHQICNKNKLASSKLR